MDRRFSKNRPREPIFSIALCQRSSARSQTVWKAKARRFRDTNTAERLAFPVPEIVFEMVAVVLQDIEAFVLDLPARPATGGQIGHRVGADFEVGDEAIAV